MLDNSLTFVLFACAYVYKNEEVEGLGKIFMNGEKVVALSNQWWQYSYIETGKAHYPKE